MPVPDEQAGVGDKADRTLVCDSRRFQLMLRDKYSEEPEVVTDNTW